LKEIVKEVNIEEGYMKIKVVEGLLIKDGIQSSNFISRSYFICNKL